MKVSKAGASRGGIRNDGRTEKVKLFISYSRKDIQAAEKIEQKLKENGFDTWRVEIPYL